MCSGIEQDTPSGAQEFIMTGYFTPNEEDTLLGALEVSKQYLEDHLRIATVVCSQTQSLRAAREVERLEAELVVLESARQKVIDNCGKQQ